MFAESLEVPQRLNLIGSQPMCFLAASTGDGSTESKMYRGNTLRKHILMTSFQYLKGYSCRILQNWCSQKRAGSEVTKHLDFIFESSLPLHVYVNIKLISSLGLGKRFCGVLSRPNIANKNLSLDFLRLSELVLVEPPDVLGATEARYKIKEVVKMGRKGEFYEVGLDQVGARMH